MHETEMPRWFRPVLVLVPLTLANATEVAAQPAYREEIAELVAKVQAEGPEVHPDAELLGEVRTGRVKLSRPRRFPIVLPAGRCFVSIGRANVGGPVRIHATLMRGQTLLWEQSDNPLATLSGTELPPAHYCTGERRERVHLVVSLTSSGRGLVVRPGGPPPDPGTPFAAGVFGFPPPVPLAERLASAVGTLPGPANPLVQPTHLYVDSGDRFLSDLTMRAGCCYRIVAVATYSVQELDLRLTTPGGTVVHGENPDGTTALIGVAERLCAVRSGAHRLVAIAARGPGEILWQAFATGPR